MPKPSPLPRSHPAYWLATWFYVGKAPKAPGTWGSLAALPLFIPVLWLALYAMVIAGPMAIFLLPIILFAMSLITFFLGWWAAERYSKAFGLEDPGEIVIDEVAGMLLTLSIASLPHMFLVLKQWFVLAAESPALFTLLVLVTLLLEFAFFRLLDIFKPWPIRTVERKLKGGLGVMADDMLAGFEAGILSCAVLLLLLPE